jgi:methyltransferase-like protein/cyclopropane fatty-acyl-phospholipid synthase-like methyltransferase
MQAKSSYDEFPYISYPFPYTRPEHFMTIGKLFGMTLPSIDNARVLELGSACGGNLINFASDHPNSFSLGVDLSKIEIENGVKIIKDLGLKNIELRNISITDIDESFGKFDYIIRHGVFSWVPDSVKNKILEISSKLLNPNGIAFVSYNALPGWNMVNSIRDMMKFHSKIFESPIDQINQARLFLNFISEALEGSSSSYAKFLKEETLNLARQEDQYLLHEYLIGENKQFYFHEFIGMAKANNLSYLADSHIHSMFLGNLPEKAAKQLSTINDIVRTEQYMDFIQNRRFRCTLLCHEDVRVNRNITSAKILEFYSTCNLVASRLLNDTDLSNTLETITFYFNNSKDSSISTSSPIMKAIFYTYADNIGNPLSSSELFDLASKKLQKVSVKDIELEFNNVIGKLVFGGYVTLFAIKPNAIFHVSSKPEASNATRYQAKNVALDRLFVTNQINEIFQLQIYEKHVLELLDGTNDIKAIAAKILEKLILGDIVASESGNKITDTNALEKLAEQCVASALERFRTNYLLVR